MKKIPGKTRSFVFGFLTFGSFCAIFIFAPLGAFTIWVSIGSTLYFAFMTVWSLVPPPAKQFTKKRFDPKEEERKAYIRFHTRMLINLFLAAILLVVVILWFAL
jgi:glucan phosphoethanolaminetransferase (alkaline phosphatase superfamily)